MDDTSSTSSSRSSESPTEGIGAIGPEERSQKEASEDVSYSGGVGPVPPPLNYKSKQYPYPISPEMVSRTKRCLWEVDREQVDISLEQELNRMRQEESLIKSAKYNFDFVQEKPLKGGWQWEVSKDPPRFYQSKDVKGTKRKRESEVASSSSEAIPGVSFRSVRSTPLVKDNESSGVGSSTISSPSSELRHPTKKSRHKEPVSDPPTDIQPQVVVGSSSPLSIAQTTSALPSQPFQPIDSSLLSSSSAYVEPSLMPSSSAGPVETSLITSPLAPLEPLRTTSTFAHIEPVCTSTFEPVEPTCTTSTFTPVEPVCTTSTFTPVEPVCTTSAFTPVEPAFTTSTSSVIRPSLNPSSSSKSSALSFQSSGGDQVSQANVDIISSSADSRLSTTVTDSSSSSTSSSSSSSPGSLSIYSSRASSQLTIPTTSFYQSNVDPPVSKDSKPSSSSSSSSNTTSSTHQNRNSRPRSTGNTTSSSSSASRRSSSQPSRNRHSPSSPGSSRRSTTSGWLKYFR